MAKNIIDPNIIKNSFAGIINAVLENTVNKRVTEIERIVSREHSSFFSIMANKIIGATQPPSLDGYGKDWYELEPDYVTRRTARTKGRVNPTQFYKNTGNLGSTLKRLSVTKAFGRPTINLNQAGTYGNQKVTVTNGSARITKTGRFISLEKVKNLRYTINIDLFPKLVEDTSSGDISVRNYITGKTGYKLTNTGEARPIVTPFIRWWLNIYMKNKIVRSL